MSQTTLKELASLREKFKDKKIVFCSGCFDLFHAGHVLFLKIAKNSAIFWWSASARMLT